MVYTTGLKPVAHKGSSVRIALGVIYSRLEIKRRLELSRMKKSDKNKEHKCCCCNHISYPDAKTNPVTYVYDIYEDNGTFIWLCDECHDKECEEI